MRGRLRPLRALLHVGGLSQFAVVSRVVAREEDRDGDANGSSDSKHVPENESASTKLSRQLEGMATPHAQQVRCEETLVHITLQGNAAKTWRVHPACSRRLFLVGKSLAKIPRVRSYDSCSRFVSVISVLFL